jgi:hypothetical protein
MPFSVFMMWAAAYRMNGGLMCRHQRFLACFVLLFLGGCATSGLSSSGTISREGTGNTLQATVEAYQKMEPRLTTAQRQQFKEAYDGICTSYQTVGILLSSVLDAADEASSRTAMISYRVTEAELPKMINRLAGLVQSFK